MVVVSLLSLRTDGGSKTINSFYCVLVDRRVLQYISGTFC